MPAALTKIRDLSPDEQRLICEGLVAGRPVKELCAMIGISLYQYFDYTDKDPNFLRQISNARVKNAHVLVDELMHATAGAHTMAEVAAAKVWSDNAKWVASKMDPAKFADNMNINVNHQLDLSSVLLAADNRIQSLQSFKQNVIDVSPTPNELPMIDVPDELKDMV